MSVLYHVTPQAYLQSILTEGLIPGKKIGLSKYTDQTHLVWLTDDYEYILKTQAGSKWIEENNPCILIVDVANLVIHKKVTNAYADGLRAVPHEYYSWDAIEPTKLRVMDK